jgi:hypothetical protein
MPRARYTCVKQNAAGKWEATGIPSYGPSTDPESVIGGMAADGYELVLWDGTRYWLKSTELDSQLRRDEKEALDEAGLPEKTLQATHVAK